jgi:hypothetical protein
MPTWLRAAGSACHPVAVSTRSPRQLWLLPVLLITVIATALGALVARGLYTDPDPQTPAAVEPSPSSVPLSDQPGSPEVQGTADATTHPLYNRLRPLLQKYFDAINKKDYTSWAETVTDERRTKTPEDRWRTDYSTTRDGSIIVYRIETGAEETVRVLVQFTSTQDAQNAPEDLKVPCIHWNVVWPFAKEKGEWRLAQGSSSQSQRTPCTPI